MCVEKKKLDIFMRLPQGTAITQAMIPSQSVQCTLRKTFWHIIRNSRHFQTYIKELAPVLPILYPFLPSSQRNPPEVGLSFH